MVKLLARDILTKDVLDWSGVHLFHFEASSCSQKVRVFMNFKRITWESHPIDLSIGENYSQYYLGINPRGLVPALVHNGEVHIESNDILTLLDNRFTDQKLIPLGMEGRISELLNHEDDLHLDLRTITFRFTQKRGREPRSKDTLQKYRDGGTGTVRGQKDPHKDVELKFWETAASTGITDEAVRKSAQRFKYALNELGYRLKRCNYLFGDSLTVIDIAWVIYINRLVLCGYPLERLHPQINNWFWPLRNRAEFNRELQVSQQLRKAIEEHHKLQRREGRTLIDVAEL